MAKFEYKKWVTENKYGKINEQILEEPTVYVGCGLCGENSTAPGAYACLPGIEFTIQPDQLNYNFIDSDYDLNMLYNNEIIGGLESIGFGGYRIFGPQAVQYLDYYCGSGSAVTIETNNEPFCCDINAINFGQTANGQPYGTNPGEPEQYLMINGPQGDMCDNSICQGNVNEPESIGDPPFDDNITGSGLPGGLPEPPDKGNILTKLKSRPRRTPKTVPTKQPSRRVRGRKTRTKLTEIKDIIEIMIDELSGCYEEGIDEGKKKKKKKKKDRCHIKADSVYGTKTSAYKSGAIVKCRKGMIWKKGGKKKKKKK